MLIYVKLRVTDLWAAERTRNVVTDSSKHILKGIRCQEEEGLVAFHCRNILAVTTTQHGLNIMRLVHADSQGRAEKFTNTSATDRTRVTWTPSET